MSSEGTKIEDAPLASIEDQLFQAVSDKNLNRVKTLVENNPSVNLNCCDKDELTPLQIACHIGSLELAEYLLDKGADVNFNQRKDLYTALMFASISSRLGIIRLLLERGADPSIENSVHRTAAQMAAFVGQTKVVALINSWISFSSTVEPFTRCRELEKEPRLPSVTSGHLLHEFIIYPSLHPVRLLLFVRENIDLVMQAKKFIYVLETLSSKFIKHPYNDETFSLKCHYLSYLLESCHKANQPSNGDGHGVEELDVELSKKYIYKLVHKLIKRDDPAEATLCTPALDRFVLDCIMKYPYTQSSIFKTMTFALTKRDIGNLNTLTVLSSTLNGPRMFGHPAEACIVCLEIQGSKRCKNCKIAYYCSEACQKVDWFQHKKVCLSHAEKPLLGNAEDDS